MKLLQANKAYAPHLGGIETVVKQVAEGFASRGWESEVLVASDGRRGSNEVVDGVRVRRVAAPARALSLPLAPGYPLSLARRSADVLLVHEPSLLAAVALGLGGGRTRKRFDRLAVWWHSDIVRQAALSRGYAPLLRRLLQHADDVIVASPHHLRSSPFLQPFAEKVSVIPYGVDLARFEIDEDRRIRVDAARRRFGTPLVLYAGRLAAYKGIEQLDAAMTLAPSARLVVVGEGPGAQTLRQGSAYRDGRVTLVPHLPERDLVDLFHACDLFVLPSVQNSEAFGIVQLEAMACGKPVVSFDLPTGVTFVNRHGFTGLVAPVGDARALAGAIERLLGDDELRLTLGRQARERVTAEFTVDRMIQSTIDLVRPGWDAERSSDRAATSP